MLFILRRIPSHCGNSYPHNSPTELTAIADVCRRRRNTQPKDSQGLLDAERLKVRGFQACAVTATGAGKTKLPVRRGDIEIKVEFNIVMRGTVHSVRSAEVLFPALRDITQVYEQTFKGITTEPVELAQLLATRKRFLSDLLQNRETLINLPRVCRGRRVRPDHETSR